jgi:8-oxo-dGTP diphosphatase
MMDPQARLTEFFRGGDRDFIPHVSVDCSIIGFHQGELKILLLKWKHLNAWSLPGGFVRRGEPLDRAAERVLRERTGLDRIYLQQFRAFGGRDRKEGVLKKVFDALGVEVPRDHWVLSHIVSIGYLALVDFAKVTPTPDFLSEECRWWDLQERPPLLFDHGDMVEEALGTLRAKLGYLPLGFELLPEKFTMPELQRVYETVLGRSLDRRNFQKKILDTGFVERLPERKTGGAHRSPYLYRFTVPDGAVPTRRGLLAEPTLGT